MIYYFIKICLLVLCMQFSHSLCLMPKQFALNEIHQAVSLCYITIGITFWLHNILPYACCMCIRQLEVARINWLENEIHNLSGFFLSFRLTAAVDICTNMVYFTSQMHPNFTFLSIFREQNAPILPRTSKITCEGFVGMFGGRNFCFMRIWSTQNDILGYITIK